MTAWEDRIVRAEAERARTLDVAWAVLAEDDWPGAVDAFEAYLSAAEAVDALRLVGTPQSDPEFVAVVTALVHWWEQLEAHVDGWSQNALNAHLDACVSWRSCHNTAFEALEPDDGARN